MATTFHPSAPSESPLVNTETDALVQQALGYVFEKIQHYRLDSTDLRSSTERVRDRASTNVVHLALLGEFNSGKTTFTNALLGTPLLGTAPIPTTDTLTYISWGESFSCQATLADGTTMAVTEENVQRYSTEHMDLRRLDVSAPVPFLKTGLILIDTPGFNVQSERHDQIVEAAIAESNACIFLMDARQPGKRSTIEFFQRARPSIDKFFLVVNRADIYSPDERDEARDYLLDILHSEVGVAKPRLHFISAAAALSEPNSDWHTSFTDLIAHIRQFLQGGQQALVLSELSRLLLAAYNCSSHLLEERVRTVEKELQDKYAHQLPDSRALIATLRSRVDDRLATEFGQIRASFPNDHETNFSGLRQSVITTITNVQSKTEIRNHAPIAIETAFKTADTRTRAKLVDSCSHLYDSLQREITEQVHNLFDGIKYIEERRLLSTASAWLWPSLVGAVVGGVLYWLSGDGQPLQEVLSGLRIVGTMAAIVVAFLSTILIYISVKKKRVAEVFALPPIETFAELQSASRRAVQGQLIQGSIQRQLHAESVEETMRRVGLETGRVGLRAGETALHVGINSSRVANALGQAGVIAPVPWFPLVGIGIAIVGQGIAMVGQGVEAGINAASRIRHKIWEAWDSLTGPRLSTLKIEMLEKAHDGVNQFSAYWKSEGPRFITATEVAMQVALEDRISSTVSQYEGLLEGLVRRERALNRRLEDRRGAISVTLAELDAWKSKLDECQRQLKDSME